jgi:predicted dehydrogenase
VRRPLNVGVVVSSQQGLAVADAFGDDPHAALRVVCDESPPDRPLRRSGASDVACTRRYEDLLDDESIDAVALALPPHLRQRKVFEALEAEKHVLVFGPLAPTLPDADALVQIASRRGRHLVAHHPGRTRPGVRRLRSLLDRGALGEIHYVELARTSSADLDDRDPNLTWTMLADAVALALDLLGDEPIEAHGAPESYGGLHLEVFRASLLFATGISAHLALSTVDAQSLDRVTVVGRTLTAVLEAARGGAESLSLYPRPHDRAGLAIGDGFALHAGDVLTSRLPASDPLRVGCEEFVAGVRTRFEPQTGRDAAAVVGVLEALERSNGPERVGESRPAPTNVVTLPSW